VLYQCRIAVKLHIEASGFYQYNNRLRPAVLSYGLRYDDGTIATAADVNHDDYHAARHIMVDTIRRLLLVWLLLTFNRFSSVEA